MNLLARFKRMKSANHSPDFAGKILAIYTSSEECGGGMFEDARLVRIGFWQFVAGRRVGLEPPLQERWSGVTVWIAVSAIAQMMVFDDIEAAKRAFESDEAEDRTAPA